MPSQKILSVRTASSVRSGNTFAGYPGVGICAPARGKTDRCIPAIDERAHVEPFHSFS
jgi:hypothetical protein